MFSLGMHPIIPAVPCSSGCCAVLFCHGAPILTRARLQPGCKEGEMRRAGFSWSPAQGVKQLSQLPPGRVDATAITSICGARRGLGEQFPSLAHCPRLPELCLQGLPLAESCGTTEGLTPIPSSPQCALGCAELCQSGKRGVLRGKVWVLLVSQLCLLSFSPAPGTPIPS